MEITIDKLKEACKGLQRTSKIDDVISSCLELDLPIDLVPLLLAASQGLDDLDDWLEGEYDEMISFQR